MIGLTNNAWMILVLIILLATMACSTMVRLVSWNIKAYNARVSKAFSVALAPLFLGLSVIISMSLFPGASHQIHLLSILTILGIVAAPGVYHLFTSFNGIKHFRIKWSWYECILFLLLMLWGLCLLVDVIFLPLTKNDALEYATVGKILFEKHDLAAYPILHPTENSSGFYGPWTHPPLYVALIYLMNVIQGNGEAPLLMRIIAPWCTLGATYLVYTMGSMTNKRTGLFAAILFLSTPLFFLGTVASLIDPLPVLGMTLCIASIIAIEGYSLKKGIIQGCVLGISLWTHSEAILFIPLMVTAVIFYHGWHNLKSLFGQLFMVIGIAFILSLWPYLKNMHLFGSPISDNPIVFTLKELDWQSYFSISRNNDSWGSKILYGLFKGWCVLDAYSFIFWIMSLGVGIYLSHITRNRKILAILRGNSSLHGERTWGTLMVILACYLSGVFLSILLNIDLMIRNERYQLIILPIVALFAGYGIDQMLIWSKTNTLHQKVSFKRIIYLFLCIGFLGISLLQTYILQRFSWGSLGMSYQSFFLPLDKKLALSPSIMMMRYLENQTPQDTIVLSLQPSEMFYAHRRMVSYLDPRLMEFYKEKDTTRAYHLLLALGIRYIHVPNYSLPPLYNSALYDIINNPGLAKIVYSSKGFQLYQLLSNPIPMVCSHQDLSPGQVPWMLTTSLALGGRKVNIKLFSSSDVINTSNPLITSQWREKSVSLISIVNQGHEDRYRVKGGHEYLLNIALKGRSLVTFTIFEYDQNSDLIETYQLDEMPIVFNENGVLFQKRFITQPKTTFIGIKVDIQGEGSLSINKITLDEICQST